MSVLYILLPLALLIATVSVGIFIWAARSGQFDDLDTPPRRMLFDEDGPPSVSSNKPLSGCANQSTSSLEQED